MNFFLILFISFSFSNNWKYTKVIVPESILMDQFQIYTGLDALEASDFNMIHGKNVGLVINHTSVNRFGINIMEIIKKFPEVNIKKIFTPEHGYLGTVEAGKKVSSKLDKTYNIEIISLYGKSKKPELKELVDLDVIIFDIQDIGSRYYTYASTMSLVIESCAEVGIPIIILDRPNPLGGIEVQGPILENNFASFVGLHPIPIRHGRTIGEIALIINESGWLKGKLKANLTIIPVINWQRKDLYLGPMTGWIPPSPNIPDFETALLYSGNCLFEGTNVSEGRGTASPFKIIGAPWMNPEKIIKMLGNSVIEGIELQSIEFTPYSIPGKSKTPKFLNKNCKGILFNVLNEKKANPIKVAIKIMLEIKKLHDNEFKILESNFLDNLYGSKKLRLMLENHITVDELFSSWDKLHFGYNGNHDYKFIYDKHYLIYPIN